MKLISRPVTFKQHQRHCREEKDAEINHHLYRCLLAVRQAGKPNTASLMHTCTLASIIYLCTVLVQQVFSLSASRLLASDLQRKI